MSFEKVKQYFDGVGLSDRIKILDESSATVQEAAQALNCEPEHIAKTMSFLVDSNPLLIVMAGDAKVDNKKFKGEFHKRARMIPREQVEDYIGHQPGGVCPFALKDGVKVYLDVSLQRFETIYPAAGDAHSAVQLSLDELTQYANPDHWVDVCNGWSDDPELL
ncbi:YbaK/EbsC family protein [Lentilactobacillus otakiensis]|uniref:YbaK/EbsC family protein n=1 Tax=Lentilactobacillus otakiensis TaxID=481720 RepID=UPI003D181C94